MTSQSFQLDHQNKKVLNIVSQRRLTSYANNSKWECLRSQILELDNESISYRQKNILTGHICEWDTEWFYHFKEVPYNENEWIDISVNIKNQKKINDILEMIGFYFDIINNNEETYFRVYGYK